MRKKIGECLIQAGLITDEDLQAALAEHRRTGDRLGAVLVRMNLATEKQIAKALAYQLGSGFIPVRKPKKLPAEIAFVSYELEYGQDSLEIHKDAVGEGHRVLIVDDLLATGGTAKAVVDLVEGLGGKIAGLHFVIELTFLDGRSKLAGQDVKSLIAYDS